MKETTKKKFDFLTFIERIGNALPHPALLFAFLCVVVAIVSFFMARMGVSVVYDSLKDGETVTTNVAVRNLLSADGIRYLFTSMVSNFSGFSPLGVVLVSMLGVGVAERAGLIGVLLEKLVVSTPKRFISAVVVFAGVMSSIASDAGYVVVIPLGAVIFLSFKRHPLAGIAAAFCGVSGGFSANLLPGTVDVLLGKMTEEATALSIQGSVPIGVTDNYYFIVASTFLITIVGALVTDKIVEPRLGVYQGDQQTEIKKTSADQKRGLKWAGIATLIFIAIMLLLVVPPNGILRDPETGGVLKSPFMESLLVPIVLLFLIPGSAYALGAKTAKNSADIINMMSESISTMGSYIVLVFFAAQFIKYFEYTNIGTIIAVNGAEFLRGLGLSGLFLIIGFVFVVAFINLFMGSASAKWAILAPIFVPMFMNLGFHPALIQMAYRIGDSSTNIITPLMSYFALIVVYCEKYDKKVGSGTLTSMMLPYSLFILISWILLLAVFFILNLPIGIGIYI